MAHQTNADIKSIGRNGKYGKCAIVVDLTDAKLNTNVIDPHMTLLYSRDGFTQREINKVTSIKNRYLQYNNISSVSFRLTKWGNKSDKILLREMLGIYSDLESFIQDKKKSLWNQSGKIEELLRSLVNFCRENYASFLSIDFVEYSPICDYQQLTIKEFERNYQNFFSILSVVQEERIS